MRKNRNRNRGRKREKEGTIKIQVKQGKNAGKCEKRKKIKKME